MKQIFYTLWFLLSVVLSGFALLMLSASVDASSLVTLAIALFYTFCFFRLIRVCYSNDVYADDTRKWFWWSWILLPIAAFLAKRGWTMMITGDYLSQSGRRGWRSMSSLLDWMGDWLAPWLPGLIILLIAAALLVLCLRNIIAYSGTRRF